MAFYKRVLTTQERGWLYNNGSGRTYDELTPFSAGALTYTYGDSAHAHAVTHINGVQKYWYDANGNQIKRILGADTYDLAYDAENRLTQVKKNNTVIASFVYDGDGKRVKSVMGSETTVFVGGHFEVTNPGAGQTITKYYFAGAQRVAMRKYTIPTSMAVEYFLGDHLGSTSVTTDSTGAKISEIRYKPWGEIRSSWTSQPATTPAYKLASYTFTGQFSYLDDPTTSGVTEGFGLMFYNARWYDPCIMQFNQPDSIIPDPYNSQDWDRYAYSLNNPVRYTDPSGHWIESALDIAFIVYDIGDIAANGLNWENGLSLAADVAGLALPVVTGGGLAVRAAMHADDVIKAVNTADNVVDAANAIDNTVDAANAVDNAVDAVTGTNVTPTDLYAFGNTTGPRPPRPGKDVFPNDFGNIGPEYPPFPNGASTFADPSNAPLTGPYHGLPSGTTLPDGMSVIPDGVDINPLSPHPETHHTLYPSTEMPYNEFVRLFQNLPWKYVGKK